MIAAILIIGGIVLLGSNETTMKQRLARIDETERLRAQLVSELDLRVVTEARVLLH